MKGDASANMARDPSSLRFSGNFRYDISCIQNIMLSGYLLFLALKYKRFGINSPAPKTDAFGCRPEKDSDVKMHCYTSLFSGKLFTGIVPNVLSEYSMRKRYKLCYFLFLILKYMQ
ncbi:hypothetical protein CDAR_471731 [Caerostris darwini]|uniref:Uncharacterized protein n=1 Tax=Caerostris darwini TaxID=1538125 RepID=A0AAV4VWT2_9ARAC|nr:hypothetical protein CDAR_471731 [Caerostris darwini]